MKYSHCLNLKLTEQKARFHPCRLLPINHCFFNCKMGCNCQIKDNLPQTVISLACYLPLCQFRQPFTAAKFIFVKAVLSVSVTPNGCEILCVAGSMDGWMDERILPTYLFLKRVPYFSWVNCNRCPMTGERIIYGTGNMTKSSV